MHYTLFVYDRNGIFVAVKAFRRKKWAERYAYKQSDAGNVVKAYRVKHNFRMKDNRGIPLRLWII